MPALECDAAAMERGSGPRNLLMWPGLVVLAVAVACTPVEAQETATRTPAAPATDAHKPTCDETLPEVSVVGHNMTRRDIKAIQKKVGAKVDGAYGRDTTAHVAVWQRCHGLPEDGIWGPKTDKAAFAESDARARAKSK